VSLCAHACPSRSPSLCGCPAHRRPASRRSRWAEWARRACLQVWKCAVYLRRAANVSAGHHNGSKLYMGPLDMINSAAQLKIRERDGGQTHLKSRSRDKQTNAVQSSPCGK
jgi:hypothetical protein